MAIAAYVAQALSRLEPKEVVTRNQFSRYIESRGDPLSSFFSVSPPNRKLQESLTGIRLSQDFASDGSAALRFRPRLTTGTADTDEKKGTTSWRGLVLPPLLRLSTCERGSLQGGEK
jgi:hypothetical protein